MTHSIKYNIRQVTFDDKPEILTIRQRNKKRDKDDKADRSFRKVDCRI